MEAMNEHRLGSGCLTNLDSTSVNDILITSKH